MEEGQRGGEERGKAILGQKESDLGEFCNKRTHGSAVQGSMGWMRPDSVQFLTTRGYSSRRPFESV